MKRLFTQFFIILLALFIMSLLIDSIKIETGLGLLVMSLTILLVSLILKPILLIISLPLNLLTVGLFSLVVNALLISIADSLVPGVDMGSFINALPTGFMIAILNHLVLKRSYS
ncbi:phage holin family protein [Eubacteriaceae bacterium ES3]|nr:phage holin family protein [Eubacteriaceae bacterium ES3]